MVLDLFKDISKTQEIIHLEIVAAHLYQVGFPLACTSADILNRSHLGSVQREASGRPMAQQHQPHSAALGAARGEGDEAGGGRPAACPCKNSIHQLLGWPGSTLEDLSGLLSRYAVVSQRGHKPQRG